MALKYRSNLSLRTGIKLQIKNKPAFQPRDSIICEISRYKQESQSIYHRERTSTLGFYKK